MLTDELYNHHGLLRLQRWLEAEEEGIDSSAPLSVDQQPAQQHQQLLTAAEEKRSPTRHPTPLPCVDLLSVSP